MIFKQPIEFMGCDIYYSRDNMEGWFVAFFKKISKNNNIDNILKAPIK